jgi:hypothetical protein
VVGADSLGGGDGLDASHQRWKPSLWLRYAVEVLAADDDDQDLDPAAAALSKSRQWVLAALRAGAVQPGQPTAATGVGLDPVTGGGGDRRRRDHLAADPDRRQQPGQVVPGRAGLIAGSQPTGITKAANEPADRGLVVGDPVDLGACWSDRSVPTAIVSRCTSSPRWMGPN